jgi:hypothetical protein
VTDFNALLSSWDRGSKQKKSKRELQIKNEP